MNVGVPDLFNWVTVHIIEMPTFDKSHRLPTRSLDVVHLYLRFIQTKISAIKYLMLGQFAAAVPRRAERYPIPKLRIG